MKRICSWCHADLGRKCARCGSTHIAALKPNQFACLGCGLAWPAQDEITTHGICDSCTEEQRCKHPTEN